MASQAEQFKALMVPPNEHKLMQGLWRFMVAFMLDSSTAALAALCYAGGLLAHQALLGIIGFVMIPLLRKDAVNKELIAAAEREADLPEKHELWRKRIELLRFMRRGWLFNRRGGQ